MIVCLVGGEGSSVAPSTQFSSGPCLQSSPMSSGDPKGAGPSKRRKERDPNWIREEILALVEAKREEYLEEMEVVDVRDLMATDISKWGCIAEKVNSITGSEIVREGPALTFPERRQHNLPRSYYREVYQSMHELMLHRPSMNPPHQWDLLRPGDGNFNEYRELDTPLSPMYNNLQEKHANMEPMQESVPEDSADSMGDSMEVACGQRSKS